MKRAFTLIELLVVIAIIAILAAILFPVFAQAKLAAKKTQDLSNQKNITTATMMYSTDSDDVFPRCEYKSAERNISGWGWSVPMTWRDATMPYVKNGEGTYTDGTTAVKVAVDGIWATPAYGNNATRGNYIINRNLSPGRCYWNGNWTCDSNDLGVVNAGVMVAPSVSQTQLDQPADTNFMTNSRIMTDWNASGDYPEGAWWWWGGAQFRQCSPDQLRTRSGTTIHRLELQDREASPMQWFDTATAAEPTRALLTVTQSTSRRVHSTGASTSTSRGLSKTSPPAALMTTGHGCSEQVSLALRLHDNEDTV